MYRFRQIFIQHKREAQLTRFGHVSEGTFNIVLQVGKEQIPGINRYRSRFNLGKIQDVIDQRQQIITGRMDGLGIIDLLEVQISVRIARELIRKNEQRIERRP